MADFPKKPETEEVKNTKIEVLDATLQIAEEGIVLLRNEEQILPLKNVERINVFGRCSLQTFYNGSGSAASDLSKCIPVNYALKEFGHFEVNEELLNLQANYIQDGTISIKVKENQEVGLVKVNKGGAEFWGKRLDLALEEIPVSLLEEISS